MKNYREAYNLFAVNGILFNHESPRRGETFVTRKITMAAVRIALGLQNKLVLGNLDAKRDWGYAPEYCEGMWRMLQQNKAEDFVLATGETHTVREFCEKAFLEAGIELEWEGKKECEKGRVKEVINGQRSAVSKTDLLKLGDVVIEVSPTYYRPAEVDELVGDAVKAKDKLGWEAKVGFKELVKIMVQTDVEKVLKRGF